MRLLIKSVFISEMTSVTYIHYLLKIDANCAKRISVCIMKNATLIFIFYLKNR